MNYLVGNPLNNTQDWGCSHHHHGDFPVFNETHQKSRHDIRYDLNHVSDLSAQSPAQCVQIFLTNCVSRISRQCLKVNSVLFEQNVF